MLRFEIGELQGDVWVRHHEQLLRWRNTQQWSRGLPGQRHRHRDCGSCGDSSDSLNERDFVRTQVGFTAAAKVCASLLKLCNTHHFFRILGGLVA